MKSRYKLIISIILTCACQTVSAVTLIELKQADGSSEKVYIDGMMVRIESSIDPGYVILDGGKGNMFLVSPAEKQIMDMGHMMSQEKKSIKSKYDVKFISKGDGPKIVGYKTKKYEVRVDDKKCSDEYLSKKMPKDLGIQKTFEKISTMFNGPDMGMMPGMNACLMAEQDITASYSKYGYPMRTVDTNGKLESEVVKLTKNAAMPAGGFSLPKGYKRVDVGQMMQGMEQQMQQMPADVMKNMPDDMMQHMSPEQTQQMQKMMEQMMQGQPRQ